MDGTKYCGKCDTEKSLDDFTKHAKYKDGYYYICRICKNASRKGIKYEQEVERLKNIPDRTQTAREKYLRFAAKNPGYFRESARKWREKYPERVEAKRIRDRDSGLDAINSQRRRARIGGLKRDFTKADWQNSKLHFGNSCAYCGKSDIKLQMEHVVPTTSGGGFTKANIVPACFECNTSKATRVMVEWYVEQLFFKEFRLNKINVYLTSSTTSDRTLSQ